MIEDLLKYDFLQYAFLGMLLITPLFSLLGTVVVENRLAFFSDALGHSALTGVALGVILGMEDPMISMCVFAVVFSLLMNRIRRSSNASADTVISVFSSTAIALGLVLLAGSGSFARYSSYLIGDILTISAGELIAVGVLLAAVTVFWITSYNHLVLMGLNITLARTKGVRTRLLDTLFILILALSVTVSIRAIGVLMINSLLILPCAAARNIARSTRSCLFLSLLFGMLSGIVGLIIAYYVNITSGPTVVLVSAFIFFATFLYKKFSKK